MDARAEIVDIYLGRFPQMKVAERRKKADELLSLFLAFHAIPLARVGFILEEKRTDGKSGRVMVELSLTNQITPTITERRILLIEGTWRDHPDAWVQGKVIVTDMRMRNVPQRHHTAHVTSDIKVVRGEWSKIFTQFA